MADNTVNAESRFNRQCHSVPGKLFHSYVPCFKGELVQIALTDDKSYGHPYINGVPCGVSTTIAVVKLDYYNVGRVLNRLLSNILHVAV
jgi:hypothetical protein